MALKLFRQSTTRGPPLLRTLISKREFSSRMNDDEECPRKKVLIETDELQSMIDKGTEDLKIINATWYHKTNVEH